MSYYILPKNIHKLFFSIKTQSQELDTYTSYSLFNYNISIQKQIIKISEDVYSSIIFKNITKIINPYENIFSKLYGCKTSISKLSETLSIFYDYIEIMYNLNIFENYNFPINISLYGSEENNKSIHNSLKVFRDYDDLIMNINVLDSDLDLDSDKSILKQEVLYFDFNIEFNNINEYVIYLLKCILKILKYQMCNGISIIKMDGIFHKPIINVLYILSSFYDKVYIIKPSTSNVFTYHKNIVCKNFILKDNQEIINYYENIYNFIKSYTFDSSNYICEIIDNDISYYFLNKIDEINIIIGQQQLDYFIQCINIFKNKNREEKLEYIKKINIQKCSQWCEKFKIPYHKVIDKNNMFLPDKLEDEEINDIN